MTTINLSYDDRHFKDHGWQIPLSHQNLQIMKLLELSISTLILRFYLLMAIVIGAGFAGQWWFALLALPVFYSALVGIKFTKPVRREKRKKVEVHEWQQV